MRSSEVRRRRVFPSGHDGCAREPRMGNGTGMGAYGIYSTADSDTNYEDARRLLEHGKKIGDLQLHLPL